MSRNCSTPGTNSSSISRNRRRRCQPGGGLTRPAPPPRAPHHPSASYDAAPRKAPPPPPPAPARGRGRQWPDTARLCAAAHARATDTTRPAIVAPAATGAGRRRRTRARPGPGGGCMPEGWMPLAGAGPHPPAGRRRTGAASGLMPGGRAARDEDGIHETGHVLSPCGISPVACAFAICSLWCPGAKAHGSRAAVHRFRRLLCCLRRTGRSPVAGPAPGGHPVRRGRPQLRDCRQHDGQTRGGHDRHGHRGRPPAVPGDRGGPPQPDLYMRIHHRIVAAVLDVLPIDAVCSIDELAATVEPRDIPARPSRTRSSSASVTPWALTSRVPSATPRTAGLPRSPRTSTSRMA